MTAPYNPERRYDIRVFDLEYRRAETRSLQARVYQPQGEGPFPTLLDVHGGAWNSGDRLSNAAVDEALAATGLVVVAIDLRLAPESSYPASLQDANFGARWLKAHARDFNGEPEPLGAFGSSSGGHVVEMTALRPREPRYAADPLPEGAEMDASLAYVITRAPISDPYARFLFAQRTNRTDLVERSQAYFVPWDAIYEGNPTRILERGEPVSLPPMLILQGEADENIPVEVQRRFVELYRAAGGEIQLEVFPAAEHRFITHPGPATDRALGITRAFIGRQLARQPVG